MSTLKRYLYSNFILKKIKKDIENSNFIQLAFDIRKLISSNNKQAIFNLENFIIEKKLSFACIVFAIEYPDANIQKIEEIVINNGTTTEIITYLKSFNVIYNVYSLATKAISLMDPDLCFTLLETDLNLPRRELLKIIYNFGTAEQVCNCLKLKNINKDEVLDNLLTKPKFYEYIPDYLEQTNNPNYEKIEKALALFYPYHYITFLKNICSLNKNEILEKIILLETPSPEVCINFAQLFFYKINNEDINQLINIVADYGDLQQLKKFKGYCSHSLTDKQLDLLDFAYNSRYNEYELSIEHN